MFQHVIAPSGLHLLLKAILWQSCHPPLIRSFCSFPKWAILAIICKRQKSAAKELILSFHCFSCKCGRNFSYPDSPPHAHNRGLIRNVSDSQAVLLKQLSHLCLSTLNILLLISIQRTIIDILCKSWSTHMIYYQHTTSKPQFSKAFLNMPTWKSIFTVPRI